MARLKKSLGQHLLIDEAAAARTAAALLPLPKGSRVLEIGPGRGALTRHLLSLPAIDLYACELDDGFMAELPVRFPALQGRLLHRDFLELQPGELPPSPFYLSGNFPYNISSQIVFRMLDWKEHIPLMVGMFQREMAQRICSGPGSRDYGVISVLSGAWYRAEYLFELTPEAFRPPPRVHSAVIRMVRRERQAMPNEARFTRLVKTAFLQRRKKLRNALSTEYPASALSHPFFDCRAEQVPVALYEWLAEHWPDLPLWKETDKGKPDWSDWLTESTLP